MGRYDDIDPEELRRQLVRVAELILRLDDENELLRAAPRLQKLLGDVRQRLFAYEVRSAANLGPEDDEAREEETTSPEDLDDPLLEESLRVVREALEREEELRDELQHGDAPAEDEEEDED